MKLALAAAIVGSILAATSEAIQLVKRDGAPRVVNMPIHRRQTRKPVVSKGLLKRQSVSVTLDNFEVRVQIHVRSV